MVTFRKQENQKFPVAYLRVFHLDAVVEGGHAVEVTQRTAKSSSATTTDGLDSSHCKFGHAENFVQRSDERSDDLEPLPECLVAASLRSHNEEMCP